MKISFIMPAYNAEKSIARAIESVIGLKNAVELIIINDGSIDGTKNIIDDYASKHAMIKAIHQLNLGPSAARNSGIKLAQGEYISFIDSDDYLDKQVFEKIFDKSKIEQYDLIIYGYNRIRVNNNKLIKKEEISLNDKELILFENNKEFVQKLISSVIFNHLWNKIYKRNIIIENDIIFNSLVTIGEDFIFNLNYFNHTKKLFISEYKAYNYVENLTGLTHKYFNDKFFELSYPRLALKKYIIQNELDIRLYYNTLVKNIFSFSTNLNHHKSGISMNEKTKKIREVLNGEEVQELIKNFKIRDSKRKFLTFLVKNKFSRLIILLGKLKAIVERL